MLFLWSWLVEFLVEKFEKIRKCSVDKNGFVLEFVEKGLEGGVWGNYKSWEWILRSDWANGHCVKGDVDGELVACHQLVNVDNVEDVEFHLLLKTFVSGIIGRNCCDNWDTALTFEDCDSILLFILFDLFCFY